MPKAKPRWGDDYRGVVVGTESFDAETTATLAAAIGSDVEEVEALRI